MKKKSVLFIGVAGCAVFVATVAYAVDLLDAKSVLAKITTTSNTNDSEQSKSSRLLRDIELYRSSSIGLPADQASARWFELLDQAVSVGPVEREDLDSYDSATRMPVGVGSVLSSLPPPKAWAALRSAAVKRAANRDSKQVATRLLFELLNNDRTAAEVTLKQLESDALALGSAERRTALAAVSRVRATLTAMYGTSDQLIAKLNKQLDQAIESNYSPYAEIPDLVGMIGAEKARPILKKAVLSRSQLRVTSGEDTRKLIRTVALENINEMPIPHWTLVDSVDAADLYEAIAKKFAANSEKPSDDEDEYSSVVHAKRNASIYYLLHAIATGKQAVAEATLLEISKNGSVDFPKKAIESLQRAQQSNALVAFLQSMLQRHPELEIWESYLEQSSYTGRSADALKLVQIQLQRSDLPPRVTTELKRHLVTALLANNRTEEAIAELSKQIKLTPRLDEKGLLLRVQAAVKLAKIGRLTKRPALSNDALAFIRVSLKLNHAEFEHQRQEVIASMESEYRKMGNSLAAQEIAIEELQRDGQKPANRFEENFGIAAPTEGKIGALVELVGIYSAAGQHSDAISLLDNAGQWGARDLREVIHVRDSLGVPVGLSAAQSLYALSKPAQAEPILWQLLQELPGYDPAFALLVKIGGDGLVGRLDSMAAQDRFEERPLIWKAQRLLSERKFDEAEKIIRLAIAIDPSDGEEGPNDRLRAYALLAEILEANGDAKAAVVYKQAVQSIRQSELADEFYAVGMYDRAFQGYRAALDRFADAYCIQSRLAIQLTKQGRYDEATQHYRRAYELMPDSFGRVESHCFGCESVFKDSSAQTVAEEVFQRALQRDRGKAQVHYLLGYLREEQGRYADALQSYRNTVAIDPEYLNAWKRLDGLSTYTFIESSERDIARLKMFQLDPRQRHVRVELENVGDFARLWRVVELAQASELKKESVYGLKASTAKYDESQKKLPPEIRRQMEQYQRLMQQFEDEGKMVRPAVIVAKNVVVASVGALLGASAQEY